MAPLNILRTGFKAVLMRSHAAKYVACVVLACAAAVVVAVPVFGQTTETTETTETLVGAGDIAKCCSVAKGPQYCATPNELEPADRNYAAQTAALLANIPGTVIAMGDNAYERGTRSQYANCYDNYKLFDYSLFDDRTDWWGQYKARTMPVLGNHEYQNSDDPTRRSKPYFEYFSETTENNVTGFKGPAAPVPNDPANNQFGLTFGKGYYSYDLGTWHIVALNSNCNKVGGCDAGSPQGKWLRHDLKAHPADCTLAYFHHPLYATGNGTNTPEVMPFWTMLHAKGADVILSGHAHRYERHAPITPEGELNPNNGIRQFVVGTGGEPGGSEIDYNQVPNYQDVLEVVQMGTPGVLELDLHSPDLQHPKGSYSWKFHGVPDVPIVGQTFTDQGSDNCH